MGWVGVNGEVGGWGHSVPRESRRMEGSSHSDMRSWWAARDAGSPERAMRREEAAKRRSW